MGLLQLVFATDITATQIAANNCVIHLRLPIGPGVEWNHNWETKIGFYFTTAANFTGGYTKNCTKITTNNITYKKYKC